MSQVVKKQTQYSMVIVPGVMFRVWDYVGDNFVHRLLQTDSNNGKLVEGADNSFQGNLGCTVCGHGVANGASGMATLVTQYPTLPWPFPQWTEYWDQALSLDKTQTC